MLPGIGLITFVNLVENLLINSQRHSGADTFL